MGNAFFFSGARGILDHLLLEDLVKRWGKL